MAKELHMLSNTFRLDDGDAGPVMIRTRDNATSSDAQSDDENAPRLVFRALFKENDAAADWEQHLVEKLEESGVKVGDEFYLANRQVVEGLCDAAAYADEHEWLVMPADPELVQLVMERGRARRLAKETFEEWCQHGSTNSAEIKINSYTQLIARDQRRIRDLRGRYVKRSFINKHADRENAKLDYAISQLNESIRQRRSEIKQLSEGIALNDVVFKAWRDATDRVTELDEMIAELDSGSSE